MPSLNDIATNTIAGLAQDLVQNFAPSPAAPANSSAGMSVPSVVSSAAGSLAAQGIKALATTKKKTRKRRRRLATLSDIRDLAALKEVLGGGQAFKTWIATHSQV